MPELEAIEIEARGLRFPALSCGAGPLVLLQHGFPDLPESLEPQLVGLAEAGYRAVAPTLRGYHRTCLPPRREVHVSAAADDLIALVDALGAQQAALIGHDWGAVATYLALARAPARFACAVAAAIPYLGGLRRGPLFAPRQLQRSWYQVWFALPGLPNLWFAGSSEGVVRWAWRTWSPDAAPPIAHLERVAKRLDDPAIRLAALAYYRALLRPGPRLRAVLRQAAQPLRVPLLSLYGERDGCMDARLQGPAAVQAQEAPLMLESFGRAGHFLHQEEPVRFTARVRAWLEQHYPVKAAP